MWVKARQISRGGRNVTLRLTGEVRRPVPPAQVTIPREGTEAHKLVSVLWVIQEKMWITLRWEKDEPFLLMESRNGLRFDVPDAAPKDWDGKMWLAAYNQDGKYGGHDQPKEFLISLDFDR